MKHESLFNTSIRGIAFLFIILFCAHNISAQTRTQFSFAASVTPLATMAFTGSFSNTTIENLPDYTYKELADSLKQAETYRTSFGIHAWVNYMINTKWNLQTGLGFLDIGFQRMQEDVTFGTKIHPGINEQNFILDLTSNSRSIYYNYHYQYLQIPVLFNYFIRQNRDYKWLFQATGGMSLNVLLKHKLIADLHRFSIDGKESFDIDSTGYEGSLFGLNLLLGAKAEYRYDAKTTLFIQPIIGFSPFSISKTEMNVFPFYMGVNLGVAFVFDDLKR